MSVLRNLAIDCRPPPSSLRSPAAAPTRRSRHHHRSSSSVAPTARAPSSPRSAIRKMESATSPSSRSAAQAAQAGRSDARARRGGAPLARAYGQREWLTRPGAADRSIVRADRPSSIVRRSSVRPGPESAKKKSAPLHRYGVDVRMQPPARRDLRGRRAHHPDRNRTDIRAPILHLNFEALAALSAVLAAARDAISATYAVVFGAGIWCRWRQDNSVQGCHAEAMIGHKHISNRNGTSTRPSPSFCAPTPVLPRGNAEGQNAPIASAEWVACGPRRRCQHAGVVRRANRRRNRKMGKGHQGRAIKEDRIALRRDSLSRQDALS